MTTTAPQQRAVPTHHFRLEPGDPMLPGATVLGNGVNFSLFSFDGTGCTLVLFRPGEEQPMAEIPFPDDFRIGKTFAMKVMDLDWPNVEYGFRMDGPNNPQAGLFFNPENILLDPYARQITGRGVWRDRSQTPANYPHRAKIAMPNFDWKGDKPLNTPAEDLIIYEMHVRSFTQHPSSGVQHPGTYAGIIEKIDYLKELGINAIELMPIFDFDEFENSRKIPDSDDLLVNYWGYSTVGFFAPKAGFAAEGRAGGEINEFKNLVRVMHENGIEVILDVVYNHTAEGNEHGPIISFRGIDNRTFYMLTPKAEYYNFSGTGNTFNCNHPAVMQFILDSLRYWVAEYHIDGFRFDLASILARREDGMPLADPPLLKSIAHDPLLGYTKLISEPWDAGGLYNVGNYPAYGRWAEWNGKYRDIMRRFLKSDHEVLDEVIKRMEGSPDLYPGRGPIATINFFTAHDGFTLHDLVTYDDKHNEANQENNQDGANDNNSWNCGAEGETDDEGINALRRRQMKNAMALLLVSQGVPMFLIGDEVGRTQKGNNNTYCQDNDLNYLDWTLKDSNSEHFRFVKAMIAFRKAHGALRNGYFLRHEDYNKKGMADITWYAGQVVADQDDDGLDEKLKVAFLLSGAYAKGGLEQDEDIYVAINMHWDAQYIAVPKPSKGKKWHAFANTGVAAPEDIHEPGTGPELKDQKNLMLAARSMVILTSR